MVRGFSFRSWSSVPPRDLCDTDNNGLLDFTGGRLIDELDPDTTENIELGAKFTLLDRRLTINSAVYRIDWEGLPARIDDTSDLCPRGIVQNNVGEARSEGAELDLNFSFNTNLQFNAWVAYNDARYTNTTVDSGLINGEELPYAPHLTGGLGLDYDFMWGDYSSFVRTDINYSGQAASHQSTFNQPDVPSVTRINVHAGLNLDQWEVGFYVKNLTNKVVAATFDNNGPILIQRYSPRKIGLSVTYTF